jgi:phosphoribosylaminoimidazole-succinocarboxamide synthase
MEKQAALIETWNLPIKHDGDVHKGKVRSVYWNGDIGVMVISDKISAFECNWTSESGLKGIPGKGASLNAISKSNFDEFKKNGLADNHILEVPHPLVWIVKKAKPIYVEAIARQYITGSMFRDYEKGKREFGGEIMPDNLQKNQKLDRLLITPSTKGIIKGITGIQEQDDVNITRDQILNNFKTFNFNSREDVDLYEKLLTQGFETISKKLDSLGKIFVDTKFEFGYVKKDNGELEMIYIDEIGTPDSSRYWDKRLYLNEGKTIEESKEQFRQDLLNAVPDKDVLLNKDKMLERINLAENFGIPDFVFENTSKLYTRLAEEITGQKLPEIIEPTEEILESLVKFNLVK